MQALRKALLLRASLPHSLQGQMLKPQSGRQTFSNDNKQASTNLTPKHESICGSSVSAARPSRVAAPSPSVEMSSTVGDEQAPTATPSEAMEREWTEQMERITASLRHTYVTEQHAAAGRAVAVPSIEDALKATETTMTMTTLRSISTGMRTRSVSMVGVRRCTRQVPGDRHRAEERRAKLSNRESTRLAEILRERSADAPAKDDFVPETEEEAELAARGRQLARRWRRQERRQRHLSSARRLKCAGADAADVHRRGCCLS